MKAADALRIAQRRGARLTIREASKKEAPPAPVDTSALDEALAGLERELDQAHALLEREQSETRDLRTRLAEAAKPKPRVPWKLTVERDHNDNIRRVVATSSRGAWEFVMERDRDDVLKAVEARPLIQ